MPPGLLDTLLLTPRKVAQGGVVVPVPQPTATQSSPTPPDTLNFVNGVVSYNPATNSYDISTSGTGPGGQGNSALVNGLNSNIPPATGIVQRVFGPSAAFSIGGWNDSPQGGQERTVVNTTAQPLTIVHEDASTGAAGRIDTQSSGAPIILQPKGGSVVLKYDASDPGSGGTVGRWVVQNVGIQRPPSFNIRDYGAIGDGAHDDTSNIAAAIAAAGVNGSVYFPSGTYAITSQIALPNPVICFGDGLSSIIRASTASFSLFLAQAPYITWRDVQFQGQATDATTSQFAVTTIATKAKVAGSGATFSAIDHTDSFTIHLDAAGANPITKTVTFADADNSIDGVVAKINSAFGAGLTAWTAVYSEDASNILLYSPTAGPLSSVQCSGNATTLTRLGLSTTIANGTGNPAPHLTMLRCTFGGPDSGHALNNGVKATDGCDDPTVDSCVFSQLAGSSGVTGAGYGALFANCLRPKFINNRYFGSSFGGRHAAYISGGCTRPIIAGNHIYGANSSSIHLFCVESEPPVLAAVVYGNHCEGQQTGETDTAGIELTGFIRESSVYGNKIVDCQNHGIILSSYTYAARGAPTLIDVHGNTVIRSGEHGILSKGGQNSVIKDNVVIDAGQAAANTYSGIVAQHNDNGPGGSTVSDRVAVSANRVYGTRATPSYVQAVRFEPSSNGPTNSSISDNILQPGNGADGNGTLVCFQPSIPTTIGRNVNVAQAATSVGSTSPDVTGLGLLVITNASSLPLNNLPGGFEGQEILLLSTNANCEIQANSNFALRDGLNWAMPSGAWIRLRRYGSTDAAGTGAKWCELSRSSGELYRTGDGSSTQAAYGFASEAGLGMIRTGSHGGALQANAKQAIQWSDTAVTLNSGTTQMIHCDPGGVSVFGHATNGQQSDIGSLTDSTGATPGLVISDVGGSFSQSTLNVNFSSLAAQINKIRGVLRAFGWTT